MKLNWETKKSSISKEFDIYQNPISLKLLVGHRKGMPLPVIVESLLKQGYDYKDIRAILIKLKKKKTKKSLDWRSPTSINQTARMIRNDIRRGKVSYYIGMRVLIKAREMLKSLTMKVKGDMRLAQINQEIRITKKLLMKQYANKKTLMHYGHVAR